MKPSAHPLWRAAELVLRLGVILAGSGLGGALVVLLPCVVTSGALHYCPMKNAEANQTSLQLFWGGFAVSAALLGYGLLRKPVAALLRAR